MTDGGDGPLKQDMGASLQVAGSDEPPIELERAVEAVVAGGTETWPALAGRLHDEVLAMCRRRRYAAGSPSMIDVHHELAVRTLERLHADDRAALRAWVAARARYPEARFAVWLGAVVANLFIDHQRASPDFARRRVHGERRMVPVTATELDGDEAAVGASPSTGAELVRIARALLEPGFPATQRRAIVLWLHGEDADAIAAELGLAGAAEARRLLHAGRERLRRRFHHPDNRES